MDLTAHELAAATGGEIVAGSADATVTSVTIDSRRLSPGALFVALKDARDGHEFLDAAFAGGATVALVDRDVRVSAGATVVKVDDTMVGLTALAGAARARIPDAVVVGITGSAGKTATKDLTAAALASSHRVHASPASFNNEAGVPLTLLGAPPDVEVVVTEMGARFPGNIEHLAAMAQPQVGVITHIGLAHAEHLDGRAGIAEVKGELLDALPVDGFAVLNADCDASVALARRTQARVVRVGRAPASDVRITSVQLDDELRPRFSLETGWGTADVMLALRGEHQVENAAQAATVALELGAPLEAVVSGLAGAQTVNQRMELVRTSQGVLVINDAYNSSPTSAAAAVRSLAALDVPGRRVAVLGEMLELGTESDHEHMALGALAAEMGIDAVVAVGRPAPQIAAGARGGRVIVTTVADPVEASAFVAGEVHAGDAVLVKASRAIGLERVADDLVHGERVR
ncbi:MAG: UDP-N-acetylmuramoyl-tripeptide--D-alanyl-D-alanine ligase [Acidimicrobiia bacterium]